MFPTRRGGGRGREITDCSLDFRRIGPSVSPPEGGEDDRCFSFRVRYLPPIMPFVTRGYKRALANYHGDLANVSRKMLFLF